MIYAVRKSIFHSVIDVGILLVSSSDNRKRLARFPLVINDVSVAPSTTVRNLGVVLDAQLSLDSQISSVCKIAFFHLRRIARIKNFLLIQLIAIHRPTRSLRSSSLLLLVSPLSRSKDYGDRAFSVTAPAIWNSLPCSLRLLAAYPLSTTWTNLPGKG